VSSVSAINSLISDLTYAPLQSSITSINIAKSPLAQYEFYRLMLLCAVNPQLKMIDGDYVTDEERNQAISLQASIQPYLADGFLLTKLDPVTLTRAGSEDVVLERRDLKPSNSSTIAHIQAKETVQMMVDFSNELNSTSIKLNGAVQKSIPIDELLGTPKLNLTEILIEAMPDATFSRRIETPFRGAFTDKIQNKNDLVGHSAQTPERRSASKRSPTSPEAESGEFQTESSASPVKSRKWRHKRQNAAAIVETVVNSESEATVESIFDVASDFMKSPHASARFARNEDLSGAEEEDQSTPQQNVDADGQTQVSDRSLVKETTESVPDDRQPSSELDSETVTTQGVEKDKIVVPPKKKKKGLLGQIIEAAAEIVDASVGNSNEAAQNGNGDLEQSVHTNSAAEVPIVTSDTEPKQSDGQNESATVEPTPEAPSEPIVQHLDKASGGSLAEQRDEAPVETLNETTAEAVVETPAESPVGPADETPDESPVESVHETPTDSVDETPVDGIRRESKTAPVDEISAELSVEPVDETPAESSTEAVDDAPSETADEKPAESPSEAADGTPSETVEEKPAELPSETVDETPAESVDEAPAEPPVESEVDEHGKSAPGESDGDAAEPDDGSDADKHESESAPASDSHQDDESAPPSPSSGHSDDDDDEGSSDHHRSDSGHDSGGDDEEDGD
jgi:hypothetical protein